MGRTNKYASLNFNDIYERRSASSTSANANVPHCSSSSPSAADPSKNIISNSRIHGHMLVLSRPTPKPISIPQPQTHLIQHQPKLQSSTTSLSSPADRSRPEPESDFISLRPQGRTGSSPIISSPSLASPANAISPLQSPLPKSDRFVPPHLRPGFVGREQKPGTDFLKGGSGGKGRCEFNGGPHRLGHSVSSPDPYGEDRRPKLGGGYDRMRTIGSEAKFPDVMNRPG